MVFPCVGPLDPIVTELLLQERLIPAIYGVQPRKPRKLVWLHVVLLEYPFDILPEKECRSGAVSSGVTRVSF